MDKKIIIDDALISTDIDSLIKYISTKKRVEIGALAREMKMKLEILKKWILILEEEGYVQVKYHLFSEFVEWAGTEPLVPPSKEEINETLLPPPSLPSIEKTRSEDSKLVEPMEKFGENPKGKEIAETEEKFESLNEDISNEDKNRDIQLPIGIFDRTEKIEKKASEELTQNILSSFTDEKTLEEEEREEKILQETIAQAERVERAQRECETSNEVQIAEATKTIDEDNLAKKEKTKKEAILLKQSIAHCIDKIKAQKEEIKNLKIEKENLLTEGYFSLETKFKTSFDSIVEKLLEKQTKIIELRENITQLPEKVGGLVELEDALVRIRKEMGYSLATNRDEIEKTKKALREENERSKNTIENMENDIKTRRMEINQTADLISGLEKKEHDLKNELDDFNAKIAEINNAVASTYSLLSQSSQQRAELSKQLEEMNTALDARINAVTESRAKLQKVKKAETVMEEYLSDYEQKIAEIEQYIKNSEKELEELKEAGEIKYMQRYLQELESLSANYEHELEKVNVQEKNMDERIAEAKENLNALLNESKGLVQSLTKKTSETDFDKIVSKAKIMQESTVTTLKKKMAEREKAIEESSALSDQKEQKDKLKNKLKKESRTSKASKKKKSKKKSK